MPSMTRALVWKEWREQRPIVIAGLALALALPPLLAVGMTAIGRYKDLASLAGTVPGIVAVLMWPLMAAACGATTISNEIGDGTLQFLLSRPASRLRVWWIKVGVAALALLIIVAGSLAIATGFLALTRGRDLARALAVEFEPSIAFTLVSLAGGVFLVFACGVFFSTFVARGLTAAAAGLVAALTVGAGLLLVWVRLDLVPRFEPELLALELAAAGAAALCVSLWLFTAGELLAGRTMLRRAVFGGGAALAAIAGLSVPVALSQTRLDPRSALLVDLRVVPGRNAVVATAAGAQSTSPEVWLIHLDGSGIERLTGRLAGLAAVSPDGSQVAYVSVRGPFGLRSATASLHVVSTDGGGDRVLASGLGAVPLLRSEFGEMRFSPRGDRVAAVLGDTLAIAALDGSGCSTRTLADDLPRNARIAGWTPDGSEVLLINPTWGRDRSTQLVAYDPRTRSVRKVFTSPRPRLGLGPPGRDPAGSAALLLALGPREGDAAAQSFTLVQVNVLDGRATTILDAECPAQGDVSADLAFLVYGVCRRTGGGSEAEIRFLNEMSGNEVRGPAVSRAWAMRLSPTAEWVAIEALGQPGSPRAIAVRSDGTLTEFDPGWIPLGWTGRTAVVLARPAEDGFTGIAVGDAESGAMRTVYP